MQISGSYAPYSTAYTKSAAVSGSTRSARSEAPPSSFADCLDKVTVSPEARAKTVAWDYENLPSVVSDLKAYNQMTNEGRYKEENLDAWLPENRVRLEAIYAEMEKLEAAEGYLDPSTRSEASNKKWWDLISQRKVLEVYGESKVVTDKMMAVGAAAYREAEREWAEANGFQVEKWAREGTAASLLNILSKAGYGGPKEIETQLEEWKNSQLAENGDTRARKEFTQYMDKLLGRGQPGEAKSPEEQIKELTAKIKTLQARLSEVVTNPSLPESTKSSQAEALNSQINGLHAQIAELAESIAKNGPRAD